MKMKKTVVFAFAGIVSAAAFATDWYVDANNGNDGWDGTTADIPSQEVIDQCTAQGVPVPGPRKTLHAMMSDECVQPGDVVKAAEGDYNEGGEVYESDVTSNRVQVKAGVTLLATGSRDATFISGSGGTFATGAYSNGAVRCVYFLEPPAKVEYGYGIVKGFTLRDGRTCSTSEHGGASAHPGLLVECDLQGNGCRDSTRGGTMWKGTALRCRFSSYNRGYLGFSTTKIIDSLVASGQAFYSSCTAYNCTFSGDGYLKTSGKTYNCFFIGSGAASVSQRDANGSNPSGHYNTFSRSAFHATACTTNEACRVVTAEETPYDATTFRPVAGSVAIDAGSLTEYAKATNNWKAAWLAECGKDYYGGDRVVNGAIDVGCGEAQEESSLTISDDSDGLVVTGAAIGTTDIPKGSSVDVTFSRNFTSDKLCTGVEVNGEFHSFGGTTSDVPYAVTFSATVGGAYNIAAVYETDQKDWYVSPTGNDANKGYHKNCPRKTLVKAMELASENAGHIVHAAAGTYNEFPEGVTAKSRVSVKAGVGLVADEWPNSETVIEGAKDTTSGEADKYGNGPNAVRCVYVGEGGYVKGFKLTNGRTNKGESTDARGGGAYLNTGALVDCELTGNGCAHRGRATNGGTLIRCYVHDQVCGNYDLNGGTVVDSYVMGYDETGFAYYGAGRILNSTILNGDTRSSSGKIRALNSYLRKVSGASSGGVVCTNCVFILAASSAIPENSSYDPDTCSFEATAADNLDENFRPKTAASKLVDAGSKELYDANFPSTWVQFKTNRDWKDGQRIYNGQIDVGCGEYDFRPTFAGYLGDRAVISEMGPNVTTNSVPNVVVPEGESIALAASPKKPGVSTQYELVYTPEGGEPTKVSESGKEAFAYLLEGPCSVQSLYATGLIGFILMVR